MYDMTSLITRYFKIKLQDGKVLDLEPPKLKVLKKISSLTKTLGDNEESDLSEEDILNLTEAIALSLSKNKQNIKISNETVEDTFDIDEMYDFLTNYFSWVSEIQNSKN